MASWDSDDDQRQPRTLNDDDLAAVCRQYDLEFGFLRGERSLNGDHERRRALMLAELYGNAPSDDVFRRLRKIGDDSD